MTAASGGASPAPGGRRPSIAGVHAVALLAVGGAGALWLHLRAGLRFPPPWPDEAHFMVPALNLAEHLTVRAPQLGAPDGILWVPDGWYVALAPVLAVFGPSVEAMRWLSFALVVVSGGLLVAAGRSLGAGPRLSAAAVAVWLLTPHVTLMANLGRMESLVLLLASAALLLGVRGRWGAALGVALLAPLVHPAGSAVVAAVAATALVHRRPLRPRSTGERILAAVVLVAWAAEAAWWATRWHLVTGHLGFQLRLKDVQAASGSGDERLVFALVAAMALAGAVAVSRARLLGDGGERAALTLPLALAAALAAIRAVGAMQWYSALALDTALVLLVLGATAIVARRPTALPTLARFARSPARSVLAAAVVVAAMAGSLWSTSTATVFGLRMDDSRPGEWRRFAAAAVIALHDLDGDLDESATLLVDPVSGLLPALLDERFEHLDVRQPTPVTDVDHGGGAVLVAVTPGAPAVTVRLAPPARRRVMVSVASETGAFRLVVHRVPPASTGDRR